MVNFSTKNQTNLREKILSDRSIRREITRQSHYWFFSIFLSSYITYKIATFQLEMFKLTEEPKYKLIAIMAFRNSGKSTIMNLSYALWSILGIPQKKFVLIISKTQVQAKTHFLNIKSELEQNELLRNDLGPFKADDSDWGAYSLELSHMGAKIVSIPREHSIRGMRYGSHRPDLIICDDIEDMGDTKDMGSNYDSEEDHQKTYEWFMSEVIPAGDKKTKIVILGNFLHKNSFLMQLRKDIINEKKREKIFRAYPLLDDKRKVLWPGRFSKKSDILEIKRNTDSDVWYREYLLKIVPPDYIITLNDEEKCDHKSWFNKAIKRQSTITSGMKNYRISVPMIIPGVMCCGWETDKWGI